jgi:hypothetical protein
MYCVPVLDAKVGHLRTALWKLRSPLQQRPRGRHRRRPAPGAHHGTPRRHLRAHCAQATGARHRSRTAPGDRMLTFTHSQLLSSCNGLAERRAAPQRQSASDSGPDRRMVDLWWLGDRKP